MSFYWLWAIVKPSQWLLWGAFAGVLLHRRRVGRIMLLSVGIAILVCAIVPIGAFLAIPLEYRFKRPDGGDRPAGIVVLAGAEISKLSDEVGEPQLTAAGDRLTTFLRLAHRYPDARLVHAGGAPGAQGFAQATTAKRVIYGVGIDAERIVFSDQSRNTCDDARLAAELVRPRPDERWLLVTSAMHMPRAVACFRAVDWQVTAYPTDYRHTRAVTSLTFSLTDNLAAIDLAVHEWIGLLFYRASGRTRELFPAP